MTSTEADALLAELEDHTYLYRWHVLTIRGDAARVEWSDSLVSCSGTLDECFRHIKQRRRDKHDHGAIN